MTDKFFAEMLVRSACDDTTSRVELCVADVNGNRQILSLAPDALAGIAAALQVLAPDAASKTRQTKLPDRIAVGRGRHESVILVRFEDDPAYGLTAAQALELAEALFEEAEIAADTRYAFHH